MAAVTHPTLRKLLSLGSGIGIRVAGDRLRVAAVRVRPRGVALLGSCTIENFRHRPAAEWGIEFRRFVESAGLKSEGAMVLLPRNDLVVRTVALPGVSDQDAPSALGFQLDGLHPYDEDEVVFDWQRVGHTSSFVVAIARREIIDSYAALFAEAGVPLAGLTYSASVLYHAMRMTGKPPSRLLAVAGFKAADEAPMEIYGESEAAPLLSGEFEMPLDRLLALAMSQMRIDEGNEALDVAELLPRFTAVRADQDLSDAARSRLALPYAAALVSACPHLGAPVNLLPPELRRGASRAVYIPTAVLAVTLLVLGVALLLQDRWLERGYLKRLEAEIQRLEPAVERTRRLDRESAQLVQRIRGIDAFRSSSRRDLDLLLDLTRTIDAPGFVQQLAINAETVTIAGEVDQAEALLKKLEASPKLKNLEFTSPLQRNPVNQNEMFRVKAEREDAQ